MKCRVGGRGKGREGWLVGRVGCRGGCRGRCWCECLEMKRKESITVFDGGSINGTYPNTHPNTHPNTPTPTHPRGSHFVPADYSLESPFRICRKCMIR